MIISKKRLKYCYRDYPLDKVTPITGDSRLVSKYRRKVTSKTIPQTEELYWDYMLDLLNFADDYSQEEKSWLAGELTKDFEGETGYRMSSLMLSCLADFILADCLTDPDPDKVAHTEYPILGRKQLKRRGLREGAYGEGFMEAMGIKKHGIAKPKRTQELSLNT